MPSFTFKGFASGASVAFSASQGVFSASGSVLAWNQPGGGGGVAELGIQIVDQSSMVAPAVVIFRANPVSGFSMSNPPPGTPYEPWRHEITYIWRVRNSPLTFERAPHLNMPDEWKDANVYFGPEAAIVFDGPGTYHVDLVAVDRFGNYGTESYENISVVSADAAFPGGATIVVSDGADFTGMPVGATTVSLGVGSWNDVNNAIMARGNANTRILMRAGVDFRSPGLMSVGDRFEAGAISGGNVAIGSFGAGEKPIIPLCRTQDGSGSAVFSLAPDNSTGNAKFYNLDLRGGWEADKERGYQGGSPLWRDTIMDVMFHRCRLSGQEILWTQARGGGDCYFVWSDGEITNWQNMGLYGFADAGGSKRLAVIGSDIHQHPAARQGSGRNGCQNEHGPIRIEEGENVHLHCVDLFSRSGWSGGFASISADQPCMRINSSGRANAKTIGDRLVMEGGFHIFRITGEDGGDATPDTPGNHVFDKVLTIGTPETENHFLGKFGGVTIRNGMAVDFDVPKNCGGLTRGIYEFASDDVLIAGNLDTPVAVYNCTFLNLLTSANNTNLGSSNTSVLSVRHDGDFVNFTQENNIEYMPNQDVPKTATPVDIITPMTGGRFGVPAVTPRFTGLAESLKNIDVSGSGTNSITIPYSSLLDKNGSATSQAFWQARDTAGSTKHFVAFDAIRRFADLNEIFVGFGASGVTVTLATGTFPVGSNNIRVKLDQSDTLDPPNTGYATTGFTVPTSELVGSQAAGGDFISADNFRLTPRAGQGLPGAVAGTAQRGAN